MGINEKVVFPKNPNVLKNRERTKIPLSITLCTRSCVHCRPRAEISMTSSWEEEERSNTIGPLRTHLTEER